MSSLAVYGGYPFAANEVNLVTLTKQTRYSERQKKLNQVVNLRCEGELIYDGPTNIVAKIQAAESALSSDYGDFTYTVGGVLSHSLLNSSDCVSGVKVIQRSFPKGDPAQLATTRTFSFTLQATYDTAEDNLVSWRESIETVGTGGPKFFIVETLFGPFAVYTAVTTAQYYKQNGIAVGYTDYVQPPGPVNTAGEFQDRRSITKISGRNLGRGIRFFTTKWSYFMARDVNVFGSVDYIPISQ